MASKTIPAILQDAPPGNRPPHCLNSFPIMRLCLQMKAMSAFPKLAACIAATIVVNSHWRNMVSACPHVWTTVRLNSKSGTLCAPNPSMFPQRPAIGNWNKAAVFSPNRLFAQRAFWIQRLKFAPLKCRSMICWMRLEK